MSAWDSKSLFASKTFWVAVASFIVAFLAWLAGSEFIADHPEAVAIVLMIREVINVILRFSTTTSVHLKD